MCITHTPEMGDIYFRVFFFSNYKKKQSDANFSLSQVNQITFWKKTKWKICCSFYLFLNKENRNVTKSF